MLRDFLDVFTAEPSAPPAYEGDGVHKGLSNRGQNNCFLNAVLQGLWHLLPFRTAMSSFRHAHSDSDSSGHPCISCALQSLLVSYKYSPEAVLPPDEVRRTLAIAYASEKRFKMGAMDDAGEALEAILTLHHTEQLASCGHPVEHHGDDGARAPDPLDMPCDPPCVGHSVFGHQVVDVRYCGHCDRSVAPSVTTEWSHRVYVSQLIDLIRPKADVAAVSGKSRPITDLGTAIRRLVDASFQHSGIRSLEFT